MEPEVVIGLGCGCLGTLIGGIVAHYIANVREFTLRSLYSVVAVLGGAGVAGIFQLIGGEASVAYWWYPVGLLIGAGGIASLHFKDPGKR